MVEGRCVGRFAYLFLAPLANFADFGDRDRGGGRRYCSGGFERSRQLQSDGRSVLRVNVVSQNIVK